MDFKKTSEYREKYKNHPDTTYEEGSAHFSYWWETGHQVTPFSLFLSNTHPLTLNFS
jgi:hypothetical protein